MSTSRILDFINSRTNQAQREAKGAIMKKKEKGSTQCGGPSGGRQRSAAYIYAIIVDGVVRYIGKGRNGRMYTHLIEAKRTSARCPKSTAHLSPRMHRKLVETFRAGSQIIETVIKSGLTDRAAYRLESRMIGEFHKFRAGQLWNTIDERFLDGSRRCQPAQHATPRNVGRGPRDMRSDHSCHPTLTHISPSQVSLES